jgi:type II secretory pathway pseudopilin PulG
MNKIGQVWIETVLYTLIGLALMGLALGFIMPKINEARDKALVEQAINSLAELDGKVTTAIQTGPGNIRQAEFLMKKGELYINSSSNEIIFVLKDLTKPYSQPGVNISMGRVVVLSEGEKPSTVYLRLIYGANITYNGKDEDKKFTAASTPYKFSIVNKGTVNGRIWADIKEIS